MKVKYYIEDKDHTMPYLFLADDIYAEATKSLVIVCTDCCIVNKSKKTIWLAKRKVHSAKGYWYIGGRMIAGENEFDSMKRLFKKETSLDIDKGRFDHILMQRHLMKFRKFDPSEYGADFLCYVFSVGLSGEELERVSSNLDTEEYESGSLREFNRESLVNEKIRPQIIDFFDTIFT